jgi:hypothetical protein
MAALRALQAVIIRAIGGAIALLQGAARLDRESLQLLRSGRGCPGSPGLPVLAEAYRSEEGAKKRSAESGTEVEAMN